jgi:hypothetical protein
LKRFLDGLKKVLDGETGVPIDCIFASLLLLAVASFSMLHRSSIVLVVLLLLFKKF